MIRKVMVMMKVSRRRNPVFDTPFPREKGRGNRRDGRLSENTHCVSKPIVKEQCTGTIDFIRGVCRRMCVREKKE